MVVTIINQHANNYGDEAACIALINKLLEFEDVKAINLIYVGAGDIHFHHEKLNHNRDVTVKNIGIVEIVKRIGLSFLGVNYKGNKYLRRYIDIIESTDLIFVSPAGADIGRYKCWASLCNLYLVNSCKKEIIFHLNTIGSSGSWIFDKLADYILKKSKIYVREKTSVDYLNRKKIECTFGVDTAFMLPGCVRNKTEDLIVFIPTQLANWNRDYSDTKIEDKIYKDIVCGVFDYAKKNSMRVELLPHMGTEEEKEYYVSLINKYGNPSHVTIASGVVDAFDYQNKICSAKVVVSMRYHGVVLSAKNKVPFVSISYENKMNEVCSYVGMPMQNINVKDVTYEKLIGLIKSTLESACNIEEELSKVEEDIICSAERPLRDYVK